MTSWALGAARASMGKANNTSRPRRRAFIIFRLLIYFRPLLFIYRIEQKLADQVFQHQGRLRVANGVAISEGLLLATHADADVLLTQQAGGEDRGRSQERRVGKE